jgi:hypothetical protein
VIVPGLDRRFVLTERPVQIAQHPQIVDRMDVAGYDRGQCPHPGPVLRIARQQRRRGICLVEILDDRQRLNEHRAIDLQRRHEPLRIDAAETRLPLVAAPQMDKGALVIELFQVQGDAHAEGRGRAKIAVQFHDAPDRPTLAVSGAKLLRRLSGGKAAPAGLL